MKSISNNHMIRRSLWRLESGDGLITFTNCWQRLLPEDYPARDKLLGTYSHSVSYNVPVRSSLVYSSLQHNLEL